MLSKGGQIPPQRRREPAVGWVLRQNDHAELVVRAKHGAAYTSSGCLTSGGTCTPHQTRWSQHGHVRVERCNVQQPSPLNYLLLSGCNECQNCHAATPLCCSHPSATVCTGLKEESCFHTGLGLSSTLFATKLYLSWWEGKNSGPANHYCRENFTFFFGISPFRSHSDIHSPNSQQDLCRTLDSITKSKDLVWV